MGYKLQYSKTARKYLDSQNESVRKRFQEAIKTLPEGNVKKLKGRKGYRLAVGGFRVLFDIADESTIEIQTIRPRGDVYKK